ncbi:stage V sporulation protein D [Mycoplasmatota bacterium]|nr:stage V sporulation protein D [Mycoplasmatota bacterium]
MKMNKFTIQRRIMMVILSIIFLFLLVIIRMSYLQIIKGPMISELAIDLWERSIPIDGQRGNIYDRNGELIVGNKLSPSVAAINRQVSNKEETALFLAGVLNTSYEKIYDHLNKNVSIELIKPEGRKISSEQAREIVRANYPGIYVVGDTERFYPYDSYLAQVLGFTGIDNQGIAGIEYYYENFLIGKDGGLKIVTDAKGNYMHDIVGNYEYPNKGLDVYLTIDIGVQMVMERVIENAVARYSPEQMLGLAMNPKTGEIYAMASYPTFEPGNYQSYPQEIYNRNLPIWMSYEPGSTFKIITYAAGLEEGVFTLDETFNDPGFYMVDGARLKDWKKGGHGTQTFLEVIQNSCNPGFVEIGLRIGEEAFFKYVNDFGFGSRTGVDLLGESTGIVFNPEVIGPVELATSAFGQGNSVTPIQLVTAASAAVNGGILMQPYILDSVGYGDMEEIVFRNEPTVKRQVISSQTSDIIRYALENVVAKGTGRNAFIDGYRVGGKTGTAQKVGPNGTYMDGNYILSFLGIAPMNDPELVVYLAIDNPKNTIQYGGVVAAPLVKEVLQEALPLLGIEKQDNQIDREVRFWIDTPFYDVKNYIGMSKKDVSRSPFYNVEIKGDGEEIVAQIPIQGERILEGGTIVLYTN